jgi:hypothetical protein
MLISVTATTLSPVKPIPMNRKGKNPILNSGTSAALCADNIAVMKEQNN